MVNGWGGGLVVTYFEVLSQNLLGETDENDKHLSYDSHSLLRFKCGIF